MRPPPRLTVSEWADTERRLSPESSAEPGRWSTARAEYQRGFMDAISDPRVREVVGVFASQTGKTDCVLNIIGYHVQHDPAPILLIQPTLEMAEAWSKDRLAPMLRDTPALRGLVKDARSRDSGNTIRHKTFPGGHLTAAGANSAASLASRPIRILLCDEVDRYAPSAGTEGSPIKLAATRTAAFWNAKRVYISSPGIRGASQIEPLWMQSDQRRYFVACWKCGTYQTLRWDQVEWDKGPQGEHLTDTARYVCESCGAHWDDHQRWSAVKKGEWRATAPFAGVAGFHVSALAAPWESRKLANLARQWIEAQGSPELLKVFVNTVLADWWEETFETVDETGLLSRREQMVERDGRHEVPAPCALVTAGVDVQDNRIEVSTYAWGSGEQSWCLGHQVIFGDPSASTTWQALDEFLRRPWPRELGGVDYTRGACVDTGGHHTQAAYDFCAPRFRLPTPDGGLAYVFAIKGQTGAGELWPRAASKATTKVPLWPIRVDVGKEQVYGRLSIAEPGPGFVHFPTTLGQEFFTGLTAEKVETRTDRKGYRVRTWKLKYSGARNEPLDCAVYAYAALCGLRANGFDLEREVLALPVRPTFTPSQVPASVAVAQQQVAASQSDVRRTSWREDRGSWLGDTSNWLRR